MSSYIIRGVLLQDTASGSAASLLASPYKLPHWNTVNDIPRFLYTCIADLASAYISAAHPYDSLVVVTDGEDKVDASFNILIQATDEDSGINNEFIDADIPGCEYENLEILVKTNKASRDPFLIRDVGLRIRYILDNQLRGLPANFYMNNTGQSLDPIDASLLAYDNTINPVYYKIQWHGSGILRSSQQVHRLCVGYVRAFI